MRAGARGRGNPVRGTERAAWPTQFASSSSGIPASALPEIETRQRCLIAHPVNPPYLVPLVEICPAPWTDRAVVERTRAIMVKGQVPATVRRKSTGSRWNVCKCALLAKRSGWWPGRCHFPGRPRCPGQTWPWAALELHGTLETIDLNGPGAWLITVDRYGPHCMRHDAGNR
jgi:hypothetical protein